ncbi:MAG: 4Fe-4S dicluster domain-containing protein [Chloroflexi bacterium]|nr:4Fe-4S dicluster domain-containing protein [Chloroflexota bacterium]
MATKKKYGFVINVSRCIDCRACLVACRAENEVPLGHTRIWVRDIGLQGEFPELSQTFVPYNCMHCDEPPCVAVCTSGATYKREDGIVVIDQEACIGCGYCLPACPYGVRYLNPTTGKTDKCNACVQRVEVGQQPACVATCLGGARMFGDLNDPNSEVSMALKNATAARLVAPVTDTGPNVYYINGDVSHPSLQPHEPEYTVAESVWRSLFVPAVLVGAGLAFAGQAVAFAKQLLDGEKEFEE